jgi:hypothetical protein
MRTRVQPNRPGTPGRSWSRAFLASIVTGLAIIVGTQPAAAAPAVAEPGKPGQICSGYFPITSTLKYQLCTWASANGSQCRIWFTAHFANSGNSTAYVELIQFGCRANGSTSTLLCRGEVHTQLDLSVPAHGVALSIDNCWIPRVRGAYQADIYVETGDYIGPEFSPTLSVR